MAATISIGTLEAILRLRDQLTPALMAAGGQLKQFGDRLKQTGESATRIGGDLTRALTLPLTIAGGAAFKFGKDFEAALTQIETLVGISTDKVKAMRGEVLRLAGETSKSPQELAKALFFITSAGLRGDEALRTLAVSAKASAIGLGETKVVADAATSAVNAYGFANLSAEEAVRVLVATVREGKAEADSIAGSLGRVIPIANEMGVRFQDLGAFIAATTRVGLDAEESATALRGALVTLANPTKEQTEVFADLVNRGLLPVGFNLETVRKKIREEGLAQAFIQLTQATEGNIEALTGIIGNVRAATGVLAAYGRQGEKTLQIQQAIRTDLDEVGKGFKRVGEDLDFRWNRALGRMQVLAIKAFDSLRSSFARGIELVDPFMSAVGGMIETFDRLPPIVRDGTVGLLAFAAAIGPMLLVLGTLIKLGGLAAIGLGGLATAMFALGNTLPILTVRLAFMQGGLWSATTALGAATAAMGLFGKAILAAGVAIGAWKLGRMVAESQGLDEVYGRLFARLGGLTQAQIDATEAGRTWAAALEGTAKAGEVLDAQMRRIGTAGSMGELDTILGNLSVSGQITTVMMENIAQQAKLLQQAGAPLSPTMKALVEQMVFMAESAGKAAGEIKKLDEETAQLIADLSGATAQKSLASLGAAFAALTPTQRANEQVVRRVLAAYLELRPELEKTVPALDALLRTEAKLVPFAEAFAKALPGTAVQFQGIEHAAAAAGPPMTQFGTIVGKVRHELDPAHAALMRWVAGLKQLGAEVAPKATGVLGQIGQSLRGLVNEIPGLISAAFTGGGGFLGAIKALASKIGKMIGGAVGSLFGPLGKEIGEAVGALLGPLIGKLKDLFSRPEWKKVAKDAGRDFGVTLSESLAKAIAEDSKRLGDRVAASLLSLSKIIEEAGGIAAFGFEKAVAKARDLFVMIETGKLSTREAGKAFDEVFAKLLPEALDKTTGLASAAFIELIALNDRFGTNSKAVADFVGGQVRNVIGGLQTFLQNSTISSQASATALTNAVGAAFAALQQRGASTIEAVKQLDPILALLSEKLTATGFTGGAAFERIRAFSLIAKDAIAGPALEAVSGLNQVLVGLHNTGLLDQETFAGLADQITSTFNGLIKQGFDGDHVLRLMQPTLQTLWSLQKDFGLAVDEGTQALLDQAVEAGIVGDTHRSAMERAAAAMTRVAEALERIIDKTGDLRDSLGRLPRDIPIEILFHVGDIDLPDIGPLRVPIKFDVPEVPSFRHGGVVRRPMLGLLGEAGPEAVVPLSRDGGAAGGLGLESLERELRLLRNDINSRLPFTIGRAVRDAVLRSATR